MNGFNIEKIQLQHEDEGGFTILSVLVAVVLLAVVSLALSRNTMSSLRIMRLTEVNNAASNLAVSKIEEIAANDAANIDASLSDVENPLAYPGMSVTFTRTTNVVVNADNTRTISVQVASNHSALPTTVNFSTALSVWE